MTHWACISLCHLSGICTYLLVIMSAFPFSILCPTFVATESVIGPISPALSLGVPLLCCSGNVALCSPPSVTHPSPFSSFDGLRDWLLCHSSSFDVLSGNQMLRICLRHLLMKMWNFWSKVFVRWIVLELSKLIIFYFWGTTLTQNVGCSLTLLLKLHKSTTKVLINWTSTKS